MDLLWEEISVIRLEGKQVEKENVSINKNNYHSLVQFN